LHITKRELTHIYLFEINTSVS